MRHLTETIENIAAGLLPEGLDAMSAPMKQLMTLSRKTRPVMAVLLAAARRQYFATNITGWVTWARANCDIDGADRDHLRAIGDMLLDLREIDVKHYVRLYPVDSDKLLSVSRIHRQMPDDLVRFLAAYEIENMSRDEVRAAVSECLKEDCTGRGRARIQPDLFDGLDILFEYDDDAFRRMAGDNRFNAAKGGTVAVGLLEATMTAIEAQGAPADYLAALEAELRTAADRIGAVRMNQIQKAG